MEEIAELPPGTLGELYRSRYRESHQGAIFPKLFQLIERRTDADRTIRRRRAGRQWQPRVPTMNQREKGHRRLARCRSEDQDIPRSDYTSGIPTTLDIMMAQEDLWIYETLLKVIRNTNNIGPDPKHDAKNYIETGQPQRWPASSKSWRWTSARTRSIVGASARSRCSICPSEAGGGRDASRADPAAPAPATRTAGRRPPARVPALPRWQAATSTTRASPWPTRRSSPTANSA